MLPNVSPRELGLYTEKERLAGLLHCADCPKKLSPQLQRKLQSLVDATLEPDASRLIERLRSVFNRLLLELIQAHNNTKQREQDFIRLIKRKKCYIQDPKLIKSVLEKLIMLYKAADQYADHSFERKVLTKFLMNQLDERPSDQKKVEKIIQTLYRSSCFDINQVSKESSRLKLKSNLWDYQALRSKLDASMIQMANEVCIRLPAESWAHLLHGSSDPITVSQMQSIIDKQNEDPTVAQLQMICEWNDRLGIGRKLNDLRTIELHLKNLEQGLDGARQLDAIEESLFLLYDMHDLFFVRQQRPTRT